MLPKPYFSNPRTYEIMTDTHVLKVAEYNYALKIESTGYFRGWQVIMCSQRPYSFVQCWQHVIRAYQPRTHCQLLCRHIFEHHRKLVNSVQGRYPQLVSCICVHVNISYTGVNGKVQNPCIFMSSYSLQCVMCTVMHNTYYLVEVNGYFEVFS